MQSVDRAALLLRAVAAAPAPGASTTTLAGQCRLNRATAWRILTTLAVHGLVVTDEVTGAWRLGGGVVDLVRTSGLDAVIHDVSAALRLVARETGETAALAVLRQGALTYVDEAPPSAAVSVSFVGTSVALHATSTGKVLLAWSTPEEVERLLPAHLERFTDSTITDRRTLARELGRTRRRGWATCAGEYDASAWGVSSPVLDPAGRLLAVLSIWGPPPRITEDRFAPLADIAVRAAARIAPHLPGSAPERMAASRPRTDPPTLSR